MAPYVRRVIVDCCLVSGQTLKGGAWLDRSVVTGPPAA